MTFQIPAPTLKPGDPPPFWEGPWHPEGKTEGAINVKPLGAAGPAASATVPAAPAAAEPIPMAAPAAPPATEAAVPAAPAASGAIELGSAPSGPIALGAAPAVDPAPPGPSSAEAAPIPLGPPPTPAAPTQPPAPPPPQRPAAAPSRSYVASMLASGPAVGITGLPQTADAAASAALRQKAKELQAAGQLGPALQALAEALRRSPAEPATYAQLGSLMLAGKAWEDACHHFLLAYMLAPREAAYGRMTLHAAWVLGYVGWAYQLAQGLYKAQPAPDLAEMGRQAAGWLQSRQGAFTQLCPACRTTAIAPAQGPCAKCGGATLGAPANAVGFAGLKLMQHQQGRLLVGAACTSCKQETVVLTSPGGPRCLACHGPALASM